MLFKEKNKRFKKSNFFSIFSLGVNAFSRAYINFQNYEDIANFRDKFDGYIFVDAKGNMLLNKVPTSFIITCTLLH
jgi:hypothetical protein